MVGALGKHVALIGFMGAGKSTIGREVARRTHRPFVDTDAEIERRHGPIPELFDQGEAEFRRIEEQVVAEALAGPPAVIALGGGAILSQATRDRVAAHAFTVHLEVDAAAAWERVRHSDRPLAQREDAFRALYQSREPRYAAAADAVAHDADGVLLGALRVEIPATIRVPDPTTVIADEKVASLYPGEFGQPVLTVPAGERAKTLAVFERLLSELAIGRQATILAFGGGSTTDVAGFVAAVYLRGIPWRAVPTTLTGMVDAAIGGKTGINTDDGKNLAGAFHFPDSVAIDPRFLATLPEEERRARPRRGPS